MDAEEMKRYICDTFDGVRVLEGADDLFFVYDPRGDLPPERQQPFATIVTGNHYDDVSDLDQPGAYRLNIGLTKASYGTWFGDTPTEFDYAARDTLLPHPTYAAQHWVCVVLPGENTRETVQTMLAEAHAFAARKYANYQARKA